LWHGQTSQFLFFGFLQGGGVAANKLYQVVMEKRLGRAAYGAMTANRIYAALARGLTFTWFTFSLLWFWSNWGQILGFAAALGPLGLTLVWLTVFVAATLVLAALQACRQVVSHAGGKPDAIVRSRYVRTAWGTAMAVVTVAVMVLMASPAPDIVYKSF
jgi:D-alanyl-lipoteichoic acid acyltransferase DltB (MBOAT superfamily)